MPKRKQKSNARKMREVETRKEEAIHGKRKACINMIIFTAAILAIIVITQGLLILGFIPSDQELLTAAISTCLCGLLFFLAFKQYRRFDYYSKVFKNAGIIKERLESE